MHWISLPTNACNSCHNFVFALIFARSKCCFRRVVPSFPRLSKSIRRITSLAPSFSISSFASRNDLPPVFAVTIVPFTPNMRRAWASFLPSTIIGLPFDDSSASLAMICWIFSSFSLSLVDKYFTLLSWLAAQSPSSL